MPLPCQLFHHSWKKNRDLRQKQQLLNLPQHKLKGEVATRWGSTYKMVSSIVEQQQALRGASRLANEMQTTICNDIEPRYSSHVVSDTVT